MPIMGNMKLISAPLRVLSLLALIGMLIAPVSTVAAEFAMADMSAKAFVQTAEMAGTIGDMPCCPDAQPVKPDCDRNCPFVIICTTSAPLALLKADWMPVSLSWADHTYGKQRLKRLSSLAAEPPARPPKA